MVIGRPASICCQCRAEKPKEIMSSWLWPCFFRSSRMRSPSALKNFVSSTTRWFVLLHEQKHHEQISCPDQSGALQSFSYEPGCTFVRKGSCDRRTCSGGKKKSMIAIAFVLFIFFGCVAFWLWMNWPRGSQSPAQATIPAVLCSSCGKYSPGNLSFCGHCGKKLFRASP